MKIEWSEPALEQLESALSYIRERNSPAAERIYDRIRDGTEELVSFPSIGKAGTEPGTLELVIPATPYILVYRIAGDVIEVGAIWHGAQNRAR